MITPTNILVSRTDSIGDVVLSLPILGILKKQFPHCKIAFLGQTYTKDVVMLSTFVDDFLDWTKISFLSPSEQVRLLKKYSFDTVLHLFPRHEIASLCMNVGIKHRIGTSHRPYHWFTCNHWVNFSRKKSDLHESQLNAKLLKPFGITKDFSLADILDNYGIKCNYELPDHFAELISPTKYSVILHTKSKGSAREWGLENFNALIQLLPKETYQIFLSGTEDEGLLFRETLLANNPHCIDISGQMSLKEFIAFIAQADALVAASTGPLHIAAALGKFAIGIFPPIKPMHPARWQPIGKNCLVFVNPNACQACRKTNVCACMLDIKAEKVFQAIEKERCK